MSARIRFGGGQADLDPGKANSAGQLPIDGVSSINIVDMPGGELRPELVSFLQWCQSNYVNGQPTQTTLIIPTKHLGVAEYDLTLAIQATARGTCAELRFNTELFTPARARAVRSMVN